MDRIVAENQRMRMLDRGSDDKGRRAVGLQIDRASGFVEHCQLPGIDGLRRSQATLIDRQPGDGMTGGWRVSPALSVFQTNVGIVDSLGRTARAPRVAEVAKYPADWSRFLHSV